jgi:hypothetical protein
MASADRVSEGARRLLEAFGYRWNKEQRTWVNTDAGRALSEQTVIAWTLDELRAWLTRGAGP